MKNMMKKILAAVLVAMMIASLAACGGGKKNTERKTGTTSTYAYLLDTTDLKKPELTAAWELKLARISQGKSISASSSPAVRTFLHKARKALVTSILS